MKKSAAALGYMLARPMSSLMMATSHSLLHQQKEPAAAKTFIAAT